MKRLDTLLTAIKGHRTWIMGTLIAGAFTVAIVRLPSHLFVETVEYIPDVLYALGVMIGIGKLGDALLMRRRNKRSHYEDDPTEQQV